MSDIQKGPDLCRIPSSGRLAFAGHSCTDIYYYIALAVACRDIDVRNVRAIIVGPPETPYEFGFFEVGNACPDGLHRSLSRSSLRSSLEKVLWHAPDHHGAFKLSPLRIPRQSAIRGCYNYEWWQMPIQSQYLCARKGLPVSSGYSVR